MESCEANLVSMETMVMVLRWFIDFRFLTRNHHSKIKNLVPHNKSKKKYFFLKAYEKLNRMTPLVLPWWW